MVKDERGRREFYIMGKTNTNKKKHLRKYTQYKQKLQAVNSFQDLEPIMRERLKMILQRQEEPDYEGSDNLAIEIIKIELSMNYVKQKNDIRKTLPADL